MRERGGGKRESGIVSGGSRKCEGNSYIDRLRAMCRLSVSVVRRLPRPVVPFD